jgi:hypothetical protein
MLDPSITYDPQTNIGRIEYPADSGVVVSIKFQRGKSLTRGVNGVSVCDLQALIDMRYDARALEAEADAAHEAATVGEQSEEA